MLWTPFFMDASLWFSSSLFEILNQQKFSQRAAWLIGPSWKDLQLPALSSSAGESPMIQTGRDPKFIKSIARIVESGRSLWVRGPCQRQNGGSWGSASVESALALPSIGRAILFYTSRQHHPRYEVAAPNATGLEGITVRYCFVWDDCGAAQQRMCIGRMERIRQQRQKVKTSTRQNDDHMKLSR